MEHLTHAVVTSKNKYLAELPTRYHQESEKDKQEVLRIEYMLKRMKINT